ncbi:MAG: hypothetical protein D6744_08465 [Planctomycetota bacterium]|nr:MAG: hypothetical protein D6744_08465 [Planctomycetota bacterium]
MVRSSIAVVAVGLIGLFGYYFVVDKSDRSATDKAKDAGLQVADAVRDKGVNLLITTQLTRKFGVEATRFLHAYYDNGVAVVYGMAPAELTADAIAAEVAKVAGVKTVEVSVTERPSYIAPLKGFGGEDPPAARSEPPPAPPAKTKTKGAP